MVTRRTRGEVLEALEAAAGRVLRASSLLGVARRTVYNDLDRLDLRREVERIRREDGERRAVAVARTFRALVPDVEPPRTNLHPPWWASRRTA